MKKLINDPSTVVREMLEGVVLQNPGTSILPDENVVVRTDLPEPAMRKVAILSGGGSGHEPAHAGYVGRGMLTAAVAGDVFTSPSTDAVLAAIRAVSGPEGALLIVKNYTGDRLNFGLAAELARAEGIPVEVILVADDVALRDTVPVERRRGIAGTIFVHKVAGAAAEQGLPLKEVARLARSVAERVASMGIALGSCTLPAVGKPGFILGHDEIEVGLGIHGEQGVKRMPISSVDNLISLIVGTMEADQPLTSGEHVALLVNGLGSTPPMELAIVARAALGQFRAKGLIVDRAWSGTFLSALDMPGFSLSLLRIDPDILRFLDAPTNAPSWPGGGSLNPSPTMPANLGNSLSDNLEAVPTPDGRMVQQAARRIAEMLIAAEPELTELDSIAGDGDLGASLKRGSEAILALSDSAFLDPARGLASIGNALRRAIGGSSGPFYATGLLRASRRLADSIELSPSDWADAFQLAVEAISNLGGAKPGDRTMIDALQPAADAFEAAIHMRADWQAAVRAAAEAAQKGADATKNMRPRLGRASYLADRVKGVPDGGAVAVSIWLGAL